MKVNFDFNLIDPSTDEELKQKKLVNGKPVTINGETVKEPVNAIPLIAECLIHPNFVKSDYIRHNELRARIVKEKEFDITTADFDLIKSSVDFETNSLFPIAKGIILLKFREFDINNAGPIKQQDEKKGNK